MKTLFEQKLGQLVYDGGWKRVEPLNVHDCNLLVIFQAFESENISAEQKESYAFALKNMYSLLENARDKIIEELGAEQLEDIVITTVYFNRTGSFGFLCDYSVDYEHGMAIKFERETTEPQIGQMDILF